MKKVFIFILILFVFIVVPKVEAHRSGCHRWHSCPSDTGSYTCGDLGYTSGCPNNTPQENSVDLRQELKNIPSPQELKSMKEIMPTVIKQIENAKQIDKQTLKAVTPTKSPTITMAPKKKSASTKASVNKTVKQKSFWQKFFGL